jgi:hypothetical protein
VVSLFEIVGASLEVSRGQSAEFQKGSRAGIVIGNRVQVLNENC